MARQLSERCCWQSNNHVWRAEKPDLRKHGKCGEALVNLLSEMTSISGHLIIVQNWYFMVRVLVVLAQLELRVKTLGNN